MADNSSPEQESIEQRVREACHGINNVISILAAALELGQGEDGDPEFMARAVQNSENTLRRIVADLRSSIAPSSPPSMSPDS